MTKYGTTFTTIKARDTKSGKQIRFPRELKSERFSWRLRVVQAKDSSYFSHQYNINEVKSEFKHVYTVEKDNWVAYYGRGKK